MKIRLLSALISRISTLTWLWLRLGYWFGSIFPFTSHDLVSDPFGLTFLIKII